MSEQPLHPCKNCKYFKTCGDNSRVRPCSGREVVSRSRRNAEIKFVRKYQLYGTTYFEVIYNNSGRILTFYDDQLPNTVKAFLDGKQPVKQYDRVFKREEYIYQ